MFLLCLKAKQHEAVKIFDAGAVKKNAIARTVIISIYRVYVLRANVVGIRV